MRARLMKLGAALAAVAALAVGGAALASGGATSPPTQHVRPAVVHETAPGEASDGDTAAQAAACRKAGIDPGGSNVQFDEQTGCSLDQGGDDTGQ
jgi:hypothetical protein